MAVRLARYDGNPALRAPKNPMIGVCAYVPPTILFEKLDNLADFEGTKSGYSSPSYALSRSGRRIAMRRRVK
jgi:hypothetical protein